jgi:hypothetical protein
MIALTITLIAALGTILLFILAQHKREIWEEINKKSNLYKNRK